MARPIYSEIRQNLIEILYYLQEGYGYQLTKIYLEIFPKCTREVIYYHLKKGVDLGEITLKDVRQEEGNYSWGPKAQKIYYSLGPEAKPKGSERVRLVMQQLGLL